MTLLFARKTDKEVYLASDGLGYVKVIGENKLVTIDKFIKVNDHVEILISGLVEVARANYTGVQRELWSKGLYERDCDAYDIAKTLEEVTNPQFEILIKQFSSTFIKSVYNIKENDSVLEFLREDWPLEMFVGGWDKDENGDFVYPVIYTLNNEVHYKKLKVDTNFVLGGAPDSTKEARQYFDDFRLTDASNSSVENGNRIYSCFEEIIQNSERECAENEICAIGEPIHIARIAKEGYELLR